MVRCNKWNECKWKHCEHFKRHKPTNVCKGQCSDVGEVHCEEVNEVSHN